MVLAPKCDLNLISLGQLRESDIIYHDNPSIMTLMKSGKVIAHTRKNHNLFTLDLAVPDQIMLAISKAIAITGQG